MKKIRLVIMLAATVMLLGCSNSDNGDGSNPQPTPIDKSANLLGTGDSASDFLSNENFNNLHVEIGYVRGFRPTSEAMDNFVTFLRDRTFKQDIQISYLELDSPNENDLTLQEIADLEEENRTAYNDGETLAVYIYFADAPDEDDDPDEGLVTLGAVYRNTSMVIFAQTVRDLASRSALLTVSDIQSATLNHEFGHLLGLVDLGTPEINDHEDPDAANHCIVEGCLMRAELEFGMGMVSMLESKAAKGQAVIPLDAECIRDLQSNGGR
ncbi:hypothetical protein [Poritiphilus flavus]|uniref:Membrane metalloprotease n=1 Tax=Poritiphilus flavus TaxID=2697053 RepID=A0A6L9EHY5_9FLAO|nr:hypothetical protein [Poritiphilus flavus]NAS14272.1 hypothetical protein [Poritiphilus flavus]